MNENHMKWDCEVVASRNVPNALPRLSAKSGVDFSTIEPRMPEVPKSLSVNFNASNCEVVQDL